VSGVPEKKTQTPSGEGKGRLVSREGEPLKKTKIVKGPKRNKLQLDRKGKLAMVPNGQWQWGEGHVVALVLWGSKLKKKTRTGTLKKKKNPPPPHLGYWNFKGF